MTDEQQIMEMSAQWAAAMVAKAIANGSTSLQEPGDKGYGNAAGFQDKWGNQWWPNTPDE